MQANKKTLFYTFTVLGVSLIALALLAFFAGFRIFTVATPSMGTTAPVGSLVISKPSEEYNKNDIITFLQNGKFYTHRIVNIDNDTTFTTKGDLNGSADALPIKKDQLVGKVVFVNKYLGWVWKALPWIIIGFPCNSKNCLGKVLVFIRLPVPPANINADTVISISSFLLV